MRRLRERSDWSQIYSSVLTNCVSTFSNEQNEFCEKRNPTRKWMVVTEVLMREVLLLSAGMGHCKKTDGSLYKANPRNTKHCQPWKIRFNLESQHTDSPPPRFKFFLFNHICYKYSIEAHFSRTEMVFNKASHVWLCSQAFSCLVSCQDVRVSFPKIIICDSA